MVDSTRAHRRIEERIYPGKHHTLDGILSQPIEIYIPEKLDSVSQYGLLIHFHGAAYIAQNAVHAAQDPYITVVVNLGSGSAVYEKDFADGDAFPKLLDQVKETVSHHLGTASCSQVYLSGFSAGYGAAGKILDSAADQVDGLILLDGMHTGYLPAHLPLAQGSRLDPGELSPFLNLAIRAAKGEKKFLFTHSEVFPGTYASTTECADHLLHLLQVERRPVLEWGPLGMQQLSVAHQGQFYVFGFAGNTAPDHMDHLHGLYHFLEIF